MKTISMSAVWLRLRRCAADMLANCSGIAATEFAVIVPIMLAMFFGTVEFSSGVAVDRKVTIIARTLSDLTSQSPPPTAQSPWAKVYDSDLQNIFTASISILKPYSSTPATATISEIYIDSSNNATITWSKAATIAANATQATLTASSRNPGDPVPTLPAQLLVKQTYLILSEVTYLYTPTIGYVMGKTGVNLGDVAYTRPRQVVCVVYATPSPTLPHDPVTGQPSCPTP
jgi:Flp pilus assembly protein TadG